MVTGKFNERNKKQHRTLTAKFGQFMGLVLCQKWKYHLENALKAIFAFQFTFFFCTFIGNEMHAYTFLVLLIRSRNMNHRVIFAFFDRKTIYVFSFCSWMLLNVICISFRFFFFLVQIDFDSFSRKEKSLTFAGTGWFERPHLFLLEAGSVRIQLVAKCFGCHVFMLAIDQTNGPPSLLLIVRQHIAICMD